MSGNPSALYIEEPLSLDDARKASQVLARQRREAENNLAAATEKAAETERLYRKRTAVAYANLAGATMTAAQREAQARADAADAAYERDLAAGMVKVAQERCRGLEGERAQLRVLIDLSRSTYGVAA